MEYKILSLDGFFQNFRVVGSASNQINWEGLENAGIRLFPEKTGDRPAFSSEMFNQMASDKTSSPRNQSFI
jgi:hypothetical protein